MINDFIIGVKGFPEKNLKIFTTIFLCVELQSYLNFLSIYFLQNSVDKSSNHRQYKNICFMSLIPRASTEMAMLKKCLLSSDHFRDIVWVVKNKNAFLMDILYILVDFHQSVKQLNIKYITVFVQEYYLRGQHFKKMFSSLCTEISIFFDLP